MKDFTIHWEPSGVILKHYDHQIAKMDFDDEATSLDTFNETMELHAKSCIQDLWRVEFDRIGVPYLHNNLDTRYRAPWTGHASSLSDATRGAIAAVGTDIKITAVWKREK